MSTLNVNNIDKESGSNVNIGGSGTTVNIGASGQTTNVTGTLDASNADFVPKNPLSNRNLIINGSHLINQRSTTGSSTLTGGGTYFSDRFFSQAGGTSIVVNGERSTDVPNNAFSVSTKFSVATAATATDHYAKITTRLEGYSAKLLGIGTSGNKITLSFWVKTSRAGAHGVTLSTGYRGPTYDQAGITLSYTVDSANTWERKEITFDSYDTGGSAVWQDENLLGVEITFNAGQGSSIGTMTATDTWQDHNTNFIYPKSTSAGELWGTSTSDTFFITGIQIETGSVATPFEHESLGETLAKCQRYYERWNATDGSGECVFVGQAISSNQVVAGPFHMKVTKRVSPTITYSSNSHFGFLNATNSSNQTGSLDSSIGNVDSFRLYGSSIATSPLVAGNASFVSANTTSAYIEMSADL